MIIIILYVVGVIAAIALIIWLINVVSSILPVVIGIAVIAGLGYIIFWLLTQPQPQQHREQSSDTEALCRTMYDNPGDIHECIKNGGH